jgi:hypothetical protein
LVSDPERSLSELEGSTSRKLTRRAKGGWEGFKDSIFWKYKKERSYEESPYYWHYRAGWELFSGVSS